MACCGFRVLQVMRESLAKLEGLCLGGTAKDQDWTAAVEDTRCAKVVLCWAGCLFAFNEHLVVPSSVEPHE